jgi:actin-related protein
VGEHIEKIEDMANSNSNDAQEERKTYAFGNAAIAAKNTHTIFEPMRRGVIEDWDNMTKIWDHIFEELNLERKNVNVLMTDSPFAPRESRQRIAEIFFEEFKVKSLAIMNTAALSMYSTGKVSGLVVESGEGLSYTTPVFEGFALPHAMIKLDVAGWDITQKLIEQLEKSGVKVQDSAEHVKKLKE